jgi:MFS family permease
MVLFSLLYTAGAFCYGYASDRLLKRRKLPLLVAAIVFGLAFCILVFFPQSFFVDGKTPLWLTLTLLGVIVFTTGANVLCFALVKESNHSESSGLAMASANGGILGAALMQPLAGYILDLNWKGVSHLGSRLYDASAFHNAFMVFVVAGALAFWFALQIKETHCKNTVA